MQRLRTAAAGRRILALALASTLAPVAAAHDKEAMHAEMREIARRAQELKGSGDGELAEALRARHAELSRALGGDEVVPISGSRRPEEALSLVTANPPPGTTATTSSFANTDPTPIPDLSTATSTIDVAVADGYLFDLDLTTFVVHGFPADLDITLTSPAGTVVVVGTDNAGTYDGVYDGCLFDDQQATPVTDWPYAASTTAGPLAPEGAFDRFLGEDPNGTWTLRIVDDAPLDSGSFTWALDLTTLDSAPSCDASFEFSNGVPTPIEDGTATSSAIDVSGVGWYLLDLDLVTHLTHGFAADLDVTLTSPMGTVVVVGTDNGGNAEDVYDPTTWDDQQATPVSDWTYTDLVPAGPLTPEGAFARFRGEDPNGTWTLTVFDDAGSDTGSFTWSLSVAACDSSAVIASVCFGDGSGAPCGCGNESDPGTTSGCLNAISVGGAGAALTSRGWPSASAPTLVLECSGVRTQPGLLFQGNNAIGGGSGSTFGDGIRCCGGSVVRLALFDPPPGPEPTSVEHAFSSAPPGVTAGDARCYQYWYRDPSGPCSRTFNLSSALTVVWQP